jgi:hypothetical protein
LARFLPLTVYLVQQQAPISFCVWKLYRGFFSLRAGVNLGINSLQLVAIGVLFYDILWPYSAFIFGPPTILFFFLSSVVASCGQSVCVPYGSWVRLL